MKQDLYKQFIARKEQGKKSFTVLIDPDKVNAQSIEQITSLAMDAKVDYFFVGGSLVISNHLDECIQQIKSLV
jgi:heptaprenylglyceryl phosphate synthase